MGFKWGWAALAAGLCAQGAQAATSSVYKQANLSYDLSRVYDGNARAEVAAALALGYRQAAAGGKKVGATIAALRGNGAARAILFFSDESEFNPSAAGSGSPAAATWEGAQGQNDMVSPPPSRSDRRVFIRPGQPYWYVANSVWHELLHITLRVTHHQTTPEGTMPAQYINDNYWYTTIKGIMLDFPRFAADPTTGQQTELYNPENSPWS
jgi:hypothetical protein